ncbi:MAG: ATP-binding protein, partial [Planctomycetota bacterium]|nr:ATP-binding protein [Planctomycetota bacterium]
FPENEAEFFTSKDREVLESRRMLDIPEEEIQLKSGDTRILHTKKIPILDEHGDPQYLLGISEDITEKKKAELANAELENQLRQAQKMEAVGTLAGGIAHGFRNLLAAMFAYIALAKNTLDPGHAAMKSLDLVEDAATQARGVTNALLTFCHAAPTEKTPFDLSVAVRAQIRLLRGVLPSTIRVKDDLAPIGELWVYGDESQLQQVVMNLAINARDAVVISGELEISLRESSCDPQTRSATGADARWAVLRVEDNGVGMAPDKISRMFEPFFTTKPRGHGTGLGLSIAHSIVADHGGRIDVESRLGSGTRISVHLPCCAPPEESDQDPRSGSRDRGESIMIVEQDEYTRSIMTSTLRYQGYEILQVADARSASAALQTCRAELSLVVLDLDLPHHESAQLLSTLRRTASDFPVVGVTGEPHLDGNSGSVAGDLVLRKPFQMSELISVVGRALNRKSGEKSA